MLARGRMLIAMVMGSGKTPTTLAVIEDLLECGDAEAGLIVCLASLKYQWLDQIHNFTNHDGIVIDGTPKQRAKQYELARSRAYPYIILNYERVRDDFEVVSTLPLDFIVGDEITAIKSFTAKRSKALKKIDTKFMFGLTGKPVENKAEELYSIIVREYGGKAVDVKNVPTLRRTMAPAWVRLKREDIADQLPQIITDTLLVRMDTKTRKLYDQIAEDLIKTLQEAQQTFGTFDLFSYYGGEGGSEMMKAVGMVMARLTALRALCGSPDLLRRSAAKYDEDHPGKGSKYAAELLDAGALDAKLPSTKLDTLIDRLSEVHDGGEKAVVFTQWTEMLELIRQKLELRSYDYVTFHGKLSAKQKEVSRKRFTTTEVPFFLTSDAGGYGVDLPQASILINYDLPWSAGTADQRNARIDRMSSTHKQIYIEDMLVEGTIEEWVAEKVNTKRALGDAIVDGLGIDKMGRIKASSTALMKFLTGET
jgi:SNF2 family DNA or RNA helicase